MREPAYIPPIMRMQIYWKKDTVQINIKDFAMPFSGKLLSGNRLVESTVATENKISQQLPKSFSGQ